MNPAAESAACDVEMIPLAPLRLGFRHALEVVWEAHLGTVLAEFADYYNRDRPHRSLRLQSPIAPAPQSTGRVVSRSVLVGLLYAYARAT
jgi:transposase InsO family protein